MRRARRSLSCGMRRSARLIGGENGQKRSSVRFGGRLTVVVARIEQNPVATLPAAGSGGRQPKEVVAGHMPLQRAPQRHLVEVRHPVRRQSSRQVGGERRLLSTLGTRHTETPNQTLSSVNV